MSDAPVPVPFETLLAHEGFVRGLARSLVLDESRADDVVQETWVTALREPPREGGSVKSWLGSVVRSRAADARKSERRRGDRERASARAEGTGSVADAVASTEIHRRLVAAVMALDEPYRSSVILRYFEGLPPREVGARTGVPAETARTRIKRGLEMLRVRLDGDHGGDRRRWVAALAPIAGLDAGGNAGSAPRGARGGEFMATTTKFAAGAAFVLLLGLGLWWFSGDGDAAPAKEVAGVAETDAADSAKRSDARAERPKAAEVVPAPAADPTPPAPPPSEAATAAGARVRLRFVDPAGLALGADLVRERWTGGSTEPAIALFDDRVLRGPVPLGQLAVLTGARDTLRVVPTETSDGATSVKDRLPRGRWRLVAIPGGAPTSLSAPFTVDRDGTELDVDIVLASAALRTVKVVDASGTPVAGARLVPHFEFGDDAAFVPGPPATTDAAGESRLPEQESKSALRPPTWWATATGGAASFQVRATPAGADPAPIVVKLAPTGTIEGEAYLGDGSPAAGRRVTWRRKGYTIDAVCDAEGRFRMTEVPADRPKTQLFLLEDPATGRSQGAVAELKAGGTARARFGRPAAEGARVVVRVTSGGRGVAGLLVMAGGPKEGADAAMALTDVDGCARFGGVPAGGSWNAIVFLNDIRVSDDFLAMGKDLPPLAAGEERRLDLDLPGGAVRVKVVDADGRAVPGALVWARPEAPGAASAPGWTTLKVGAAQFAGDDGSVLLAGLPTTGSCAIDALDDATGRKSKATAVPGTSDAPAEVTLTLGK